VNQNLKDKDYYSAYPFFFQDVLKNFEKKMKFSIAFVMEL